jgi:hypothetical protein
VGGHQVPHTPVQAKPFAAQGVPKAITLRLTDTQRHFVTTWDSELTRGRTSFLPTTETAKVTDAELPAIAHYLVTERVPAEWNADQFAADGFNSIQLSRVKLVKTDQLGAQLIAELGNRGRVDLLAKIAAGSDPTRHSVGRANVWYIHEKLMDVLGEFAQTNDTAFDALASAAKLPNARARYVALRAMEKRGDAKALAVVKTIWELDTPAADTDGMDDSDTVQATARSILLNANTPAK